MGYKGSNFHRFHGCLLHPRKCKHDTITVQGIKFLQTLENINPQILYGLNFIPLKLNILFILKIMIF